MKRSGRKSAAQTPAPISERIKGSKRNPKGSAASSESANKINLSDNIIKVLKEKADAYNEKHPKSKVSVSTLKAIFRRGAGAYSSSHRPTITGGRPNSRTAWAYARVNKFLLKKGGTKVKAAYVQDDDMMAKGAILGSSCKTYIANNESVLKTGYYLNLSDFSSMIDPYGQIPLNLNYTLVTYNSGNQDGLSLIDTINPINLQNEIAEILNISINNAKVLVGLYIEMGKKLKSISQIEGDNIIVIDRDKVVCKSDSENEVVYDSNLYAESGDLAQEITCRRCLWTWNTSNSDEHDKYICHNCGFDNRTYYDSDPIGNAGIANLNKNGIVLKDKYDTISLIAYNTGNQKRESSLYNKSLIYKSVQPIKSANEIIQSFDLQDFENFSEDKIEDYQKNHLIIINQNEVVYDSGNPDIRYEEGGLIAPNGKKSNLTHEQWHLVRTPAFKAWFGDWENDPKNASKVIDENGEPLVVYRGGVQGSMNNTSGIWLSKSKQFAENYGKVSPYFVKVLKPIPNEVYDNTPVIMGGKFRYTISINNYISYDGYLGNFFRIVVKKYNQIKLADGTNTTFDANNPDIRYENGGEMHKNIALPDTYSTFDKLKPILANQGYELNKIGDNNFAEGGLLKPTMSVAQIAKKHGKKESYIEKQLEIGTKHELEHSYSEELAKKTALHHLADMADYYTRLKKMELQQEAEKLTNYYADGGVTDYGTCEVLDEDGERMIDEKSIKQLTECVMNLPQTKSFHIDFETSQYKPYRRRLHKDIIYQIKKDLICVEREEPIAILLGGSPASGKSTFLKRYAPYLLSDEILKIDADEIRAKLPEYRGYNAAQTHLETKDIVTTLLSDRNIGIPCTFDVIYDGTMNNTKSYAPLIQLLKSLGYKVFIIYIDKVPKDVAISRALKRYQNSGRFVPVEVIEDFFTKGKTALNELKSSVDGYMIVDGSDKNYHVIERGGIKIPQDRSYSNIGSPIQITTEDVVREFAKGGQVGMQGSIKHSSGAAGGYLVGKRHSEGGIKAINKSTNQPLEMEGGEVVITRNAVSDSEKREFEGEMLTNREILSRINQSGGGVSFEKGGQTDYKCACNGKKYAYGGKVLSDYEIVNQINGLYPSSGIMTFSEYKDQFNKEASTKDYFNHLQKTGVDTSTITFTERAKLLTY